MFDITTFDLTVTFDNGPEPAVTPVVLDVLAHHGVLSTFFVIGSAVMSRNLLRRVARPKNAHARDRTQAAEQLPGQCHFMAANGIRAALAQVVEARGQSGQSHAVGCARLVLVG